DPQSQYAAVIPLFASALRDGARPRIYGDGEQSRDFTYIDNVVEANMAACTQGTALGQAINVACGERYTLLALLQAMGRLLSVQAEPEFLPARPGDVRHSRRNTRLPARGRGFRPRAGSGGGRGGRGSITGVM